MRSKPKYDLDDVLLNGATLFVDEASRAAMVMEIPAAARRVTERKVKNCFTMTSRDRMPEGNVGALAFAELVACKIA